jgi:hypothetical protein
MSRPYAFCAPALRGKCVVQSGRRAFACCMMLFRAGRKKRIKKRGAEIELIPLQALMESPRRWHALCKRRDRTKPMKNRYLGALIATAFCLTVVTASAQAAPAAAAPSGSPGTPSSAAPAAPPGANNPSGGARVNSPSAPMPPGVNPNPPPTSSGPANPPATGQNPPPIDNTPPATGQNPPAMGQNPSSTENPPPQQTTPPAQPNPGTPGSANGGASNSVTQPSMP